MRKPLRQPQADFVTGAEPQQMPWQKNLEKKFSKENGKIIGLRLPEHHAACLEYLSELDDRSQHSKLIAWITKGIEDDIKKVSE